MTVELDDTAFGVILLAIIGIVVGYLPVRGVVERPRRPGRPSAA